MSKLRKTILIIGILIVAVAASLGTALALYATGSMKTDPIELVYVLRDREKIYDGTPLKLDDQLNDIMLKEGKLSAGHYAKVEFLGSQTDVGESESDATVKIYDENGFNVTGDYSIKVQSAYLTVYKKTISVELPAQKVVYNGSKVLFNEYKISDDSAGGLCSGHRIYGSTDAELLNVGDTLPDDLEPLIFDVAGKDVTANYEIVDFKYDGIEVVKRPITVRPVSYEKVYDGKAMFAKEIEFVGGSSLVDGQICEFVINEGYGDHVTNVDEVETQVTSLFIYDYKDGEKVDVTENYEFNLQEYTGYLKVTPRPLTVSAKSGTFVYNGDEQSMQNDKAPLSVEGLAEGEELVSVSYLGSRRDVGVSENVIAEVNLRGLIENYEITRVPGTIEITPFETTVRTFSSEKYYDGDPLTDGHIEYTLANENHNVVSGELPSITNVGEIKNKYDITFVDEYGDCTHNYAITFDYGSLTVKRLPVKVTLVSDDDREKVNYDGTTHAPTLENEDYFNVAPLLPDGETVDKFTLEYTDFEVVAETRAMCVAGEYYYTVKFKDKEVAQRQRYSNYELYVPESGVLEVTPLPISVTLKEFTEEAAFTYTGKALKVDVNKAIDGISLQRGVTLTEGILLTNLITKNDFSVVADEIIDAGDDYLYTVKITDTGTAKNFDVEVSGVQISVNPMPVTVTLKDAARTYNGEAQTVEASETVTKIEKTPPVAEGDYADDTGLTAGDLSVVFTASTPDKVKDSDNYPFEVEVSKKKLQKNYKLAFKSADDNAREYALLKIAKFTLEVTTDTPDLTYNGLNQSSGEFTYGELANAKHRVSRLTNINRLPVVRDVCDAAGRKLKVENRFEVAVYDGTENVTENYKLDYTFGELSVKPLPITVSTGSSHKVYDGTALRNTEITSDIELCLDHRLTALEDVAEITDVGTVRNEYLWDILSGGTSVISNYEVTTDYGELEVTRRAITLKTDGETRAYNGEKLYNTTVTIIPSLTGAMRNYRAQLPADAQPFGITNAGSVKNVFDCVIVTGAGANVTDNFDISYSEDCGTLTVTPVAITFSLDDFADNEDVDMEYDGKQKKFEINQAIKHITLDGTEYEVLSEKTGGGIEFAKSDFEIEYSSAIIDAGNYSYTVKFTDEAFANNFTVVNPEKQMTCTVRVKKKAISINVKSLTGDEALVFNNKVQELEVKDIVLSIWDKKKAPVSSELISAKELTLVCSEELFNAGDYTYKVKIEDDVFAKNFLYTEPEVDITVKQFNVNVTLKDLTATYSGEEFVFPADTAGVLSAKLNDDENIRDVLSGADFAFAAKDGKLIIDADEYDYVAVLTDETKARNYHLTMGDATVFIEQLEVNVTAKPVMLTFNGKELEIDGGTALDIGNPLLTADDFDFTTWQGIFKTPLLKSGDYTYKAELKNGNFSIIDYDDGVVTGGTVKVNKCAVTVTLNALSKEYDGEEFDLSPKKSVVIIDGKEFTLTQSPIASVESDVFTKDDFVLIYDEVTPLDDHSNFGTYNLTAKLVESYEDFSGDVEITVENGTATISKKKVTLTTQTKSFEYNGERQSATEAELVGAVAGHYAKAVDDNRAIVSVINVTATPVDNDSEYRIFRKVVNADDSETEVDVTENYDIKTVYGTLTVTPLAVTITTEGASRPYNGRALSNAEVTADGLIAGHTLVTPEEADLPSVTEVEKIRNEYDITITAIVDGSATDVTGNYEITFVYGDLEVTAIEITLNLKDNIQTPYKGLNGNISLNGGDVIDSVDGDDSLGLNDFAVTFDGEAVNAGDYTFTVALKSEEDAKHYSIISGDSGVCTVTKADFTVTLKAYTGATAREYTGAVQEAKASDVTITANAANNPDDITAEGLEFRYSGGMLNVGEYTYTVEIKDKELAGNYNLTAEAAKYDIVPAEITVTLQNYEKTYNGTAYTVDVLLAITGITDKNGDKSELLEKSDFKAVYEQEMRLANGILKPLPDDEAYTGEIKLIDDKAYKVITGDNYTYGVELIDRNMRGNFDITVVGGEFKINKRLLTFTAVNVYMSREDYEMGGYADELEFEVTDYVSISSNTTLAGDDQLRIKKAIAEKEYTDSTVLYLYAFDEYTLDNEDCYDFTNVNGKVPVSLQLIFTD